MEKLLASFVLLYFRRKKKKALESLSTIVKFKKGSESLLCREKGFQGRENI